MHGNPIRPPVKTKERIRTYDIVYATFYAIGQTSPKNNVLPAIELVQCLQTVFHDDESTSNPVEVLLDSP